jgi:hypothetical protein
MLLVNTLGNMQIIYLRLDLFYSIMHSYLLSYFNVRTPLILFHEEIPLALTLIKPPKASSKGKKQVSLFGTANPISGMQERKAQKLSLEVLMRPLNL